MVYYDWKHPEKFFFDVIEHFDGKINLTLETYTCEYFKDNQNKIKKYLEDKNEFPFSNICINILMNIEFKEENKEENKWLLPSGYCEFLPMFFPMALFYKTNNNDENENDYGDELFSFDGVNEDILEKCREYLFFNKNIRKICNSCSKDAVYNCKECDNVDFCEECHQTSKYEKLHMKKLNDNDNDKKGLCDICGKKEPIYSNNDYYCLCKDCFVDNPHRNHQLTKIEKKSNLFNDNQIIAILKKSLYYHFAVQILDRCYRSHKWIKFEKNDICQIFNCENPIIIAYIELQKIKEKTLQELKEIELEFSELFDKMIRKYFVYEFRIFDFFFRSANNIIVFGSDENCVKFCHDGIKMVKSIKNKKVCKKENNDLKLDDDIIEL
jgi:hypothetical protein